MRTPLAYAVILTHAVFAQEKAPFQFPCLAFTHRTCSWESTSKTIMCRVSGEKRSRFIMSCPASLRIPDCFRASSSSSPMVFPYSCVNFFPKSGHNKRRLRGIVLSFSPFIIKLMYRAILFLYLYLYWGLLYSR